MGHLLPAMTQEKLDTQRDVVKNERRWTVDNRPYGTWWEKLPALVFPQAHPFHHSLIGSMEDLDAASLDDIASFFRTYYTPDNAVLTVAGDFEPSAVRASIDRHFGPIPRGAGKPPLASVDLPATFGAWLRERVSDNVPLPRLLLAFRIAPFGSTAWYVAHVCAAILGMRRGSRLYRALVREKEIASEASAFTYDLSKGSDLLVIDVTARPGIDDDALEAAVVHEVDIMIRDGVRPEECARAVALIETDFLAAMQTAQERADRLSMFATYFDDPSRINTELDRFRSVSASDVAVFAREALGATNRASLVYTPRDVA
jgi:predicted Zn-dependent peptidase